MTNRCPITYNHIPEGTRYSQRGLKQLSPALKTLNLLPFTTDELLVEARKRILKLSIQGMQPKLSASLDIPSSQFKLVDHGGKYIFKPQNPLYPQAPENEDLSMRLAKAVGIQVPFHALLYAKDMDFVYCIKRFDRIARNKKVSVEDFAQLSGNTRNTKYRYSMEKLISIVEKYTTFPALEKAELFLRTITNYLIGNEDMHLKNFSLIYHADKVTLAPAYDVINSTIILPQAQEELALPLNGKKRNLTKKDFIDYFGKDKLSLTDKVLENQLDKIRSAIPTWFELIGNSFLNEPLKIKYVNLVKERLLLFKR